MDTFHFMECTGEKISKLQSLDYDSNLSDLLVLEAIDNVKIAHNLLPYEISSIVYHSDEVITLMKSNNSISNPELYVFFRDELINGLYLYHYLPRNIFNQLNSPQHIFHSLTVMLKPLLADSIEERKIYTHIHNSSKISILVLERNQILFCNTYEVSHSNDVLYFVMLIFQQMDLNPEVDTLQLTGKIRKSSVLYENLYKCIRHIEILDLYPTYFMHPPDDRFNRQDFFELISIDACESYQEH